MSDKNRHLIKTCFIVTSLFGAFGCADDVAEKPETPVKSEQRRQRWYGQPPWYERFQWKPEEHFQSPEMIEFCKAIQEDDLPAIQKLLKSGIEVNKTGTDNATLLLWAYSSPNPNIFRLLLEHGADPNIPFKSRFGSLGLNGYTGLSKGDCITLLASRLPGDDRFGLVAEHGGNLDFVHAEDGTTPLIESVDVATPEIRRQRVARIIAANANLNRQLTNGTTAMSTALWRSHYDTVSMLLDAGADPNLFDFRNQQLLHNAALQQLRREKSNRERREMGGREIPFYEVDEWNQMIPQLEKVAKYTLEQAHEDLQLQEEWREKGLGNYLLQRRKKIEKSKTRAGESN